MNNTKSNFEEYALSQCVKPQKYHAMIIDRDKLEESEFQMNVYPSIYDKEDLTLHSCIYHHQ